MLFARRTSFVVLALLVVATLATSCGSGGGSAASGSGQLVTLNTPAAPAATTGVAYATQFEATFPHPPGVYLISGGTLPLGLKLDTETGELTGFPRQVGVFHFEVAARDGIDPSLPNGRDSSFAEDRKAYSIDVALGAPNILPQILPSAQYRASYSYQIDVAGGTAPYTFAQTGGVLPSGLTVSPTGRVGNFPTSASQPSYSFEVTVTDANGLTDTDTLTVEVVVLPLIILTSTLPEAAATFPYETVLQLASAGAGVPYTWAQEPLLPGETSLGAIGMEISVDGHIRPTGAFTGPTSTGTFLFTVSVKDEASQIATRQYSLKVNPGPVLTSITPNRSSSAGPFVALGANFQTGAYLVFKPGPTQVVINPTVGVGGTTLGFSNAPASPPGGGSVTVRVVNPDGGYFDLVNGFLFPFATLSFGTKGFIPSPISSTGLDCADITGDGKAEVIHAGAAGFVSNSYSSGATSTAGGLRYYRNLGGLTFSETILDTGNFYDCRFVDVNVDGKLDVVALGQSSIKTWINTGGGNLVAGPVSSLPSINGSPYPSQMDIGFINGDSIPDIAFGVSTYANSNGQVHTMRGDGSGGFVALSSAISNLSGVNGVISVAILDINGDGRNDLVAGTGFSNGLGPNFFTNVTASDGTMAASWSASPNTTLYYSNTMSVGRGNPFGDGRPALVSLRSQDPSDGNQKAVILWSGSNLGTSQTLTAPAGLGKSVRCFDLDYDGRDDFAVSFYSAGIQIYRGSTFAAVQALDASVGSPSVSAPRTGRLAAGDLDGDGKLDVLAATSYWATDYQPYLYSGSYALGLAGNGGTMGIVFYLNSSN